MQKQFKVLTVKIIVNNNEVKKGFTKKFKNKIKILNSDFELKKI